jgi:multimeric flavodoxin WrbA
MKILGLSCSPRKDGNTVAMINAALKAAKKAGAEVELYSVAGKTLEPCRGCWGCQKTGKCVIVDDAVPEIFDKMLAADGIIIGTPVYFYGMTAQAKALMDRTISIRGPERSLANKVCGVVTSAGSLGMVDVLKDWSYFIVQHAMLPANQVAAYFMSPDDLKTMPKCLNALEQLGKQMVALVNKKFTYPGEFLKGPGAFGTHTK